jgi:hypothetical protein
MLALMAASTAMSVMGQAQAASAQQDAANAQAQQALNEGAYKADAAKAQAADIRKAGRAQQGEANASLAASGVKLGEGTPLEIQKTITTNVEEDALSAILSGKRATDSAQEEAKLLGKAGENAQTKALYGSAATVLGAGAQAMGGWKSTAPSSTYEATRDGWY